MPRVRFSSIKIVSGGQTGADRAALDFALEHGLPHGGWCPHGRLAEDGTIDRCYRLRPTPSAAYAQRTEWNVRDSDGTVIFSIGRTLHGGSLLTVEYARRLGKPWLHLARSGGLRHPEQMLAEFIETRHIRVLNVAGPRASTEARIMAFVREVLGKTMIILRDKPGGTVSGGR